MGKKIVLLALLVSLFTFFIILDSSYEVKADNFDWYDAGAFRKMTYGKVLSTWQKGYQTVEFEQEITSNEIALQNSEVESALVDEIGLALKPKMNEKITLNVIAPQKGLYHIGLKYSYQVPFNKRPKIGLEINNEYQYNELSEIELGVRWKNVMRSDDERYNRYGDELLPLSVPIIEWQEEFLKDQLNAYQEPYYFLLDEGINEITINFLNDDLLISSILIGDNNQLISYLDYFDLAKGKIINQNAIQIEGEDFIEKNDIEIKGSYYKGVKMSPNDYKTTVLNMLDGESWSRGGMKAIYQFNVKEEGYYALTLKYKQNTLAGIAVGKNIYLDGFIPFKEMQGYLFPSTKRFVNHTLANNEPYYFFLTEGVHEIALESTTSHITEIISSLYDVMDKINSIGLIIKSITGNSLNGQIDWNIIKYLPSLSSDLIKAAMEVELAYNQINDLNATTKKATEVSVLQIASSQLKRLAKYPNKISNRLSELCDGSGSAYQLIGNAIGTLGRSPLDIDYFVFHGINDKLSNANGNIFARFWYGLKSFIFSFFDKRYRLTSSDDESLQIWIAQSALYTNILQNMIDEDFTKKTNIKVQLHILPSSQKIILNNATKTNPDLVLAIDSWTPYTYALRGMLEDLSQYDGFDDISSNIYASNFTPLIYETGVFGIPETQGMQLMFYRTDIFNYLGISPPNTWDDVIQILPTLQSYQMNFYHPLGHESAYKGFGQTSAFFYLMDAEIYHPNGYLTVINNEKSIEAIQMMTNLFTLYNLPQQVGSFFEHFRSGFLPIGLASIDFYLQLKYACPELAGQWAVMPIPGKINEVTNEIERWTTTYGKSSIMFKSSERKNDAWQFLKWYHETSVQSEYVNQIKMVLGEKYLIVPANIDSLASSVWDDKIKTEIINQAKWSRIPAIVPGSYIIEREISNIWNLVVIDKVNVRVAVNQSIAKINRELARKFEEFGYLKGGIMIKPYIVPMKDNIDEWLRGRAL